MGLNQINNLPEYAKDCKFVVVTEWDGSYWFYGGYDPDEESRAYKAAREVDGFVIVVGA